MSVPLVGNEEAFPEMRGAFSGDEEGLKEAFKARARASEMVSARVTSERIETDGTYAVGRTVVFWSMLGLLNPSVVRMSREGWTTLEIFVTVFVNALKYVISG